MNESEIREFIEELEEVSFDRSLGEDLIVYQTKEQMFALLQTGKIPIRLSLRCDPVLAKHLRDKYDEVMQGDHLDPNKWNTIVLTGQLTSDDIKDLIRHSYLLVRD